MLQITFHFVSIVLKGKHRSERKGSKSLELIHSDVCGTISSKSQGGAEYFVTFIDDKTKYVWAY